MSFGLDTLLSVCMGMGTDRCGHLRGIQPSRPATRNSRSVRAVVPPPSAAFRLFRQASLADSSTMKLVSVAAARLSSPHFFVATGAANPSIARRPNGSSPVATPRLFAQRSISRFADLWNLDASRNGTGGRPRELRSSPWCDGRWRRAPVLSCYGSRAGRIRNRDEKRNADERPPVGGKPHRHR